MARELTEHDKQFLTPAEMAAIEEDGGAGLVDTRTIDVTGVDEDEDEGSEHEDASDDDGAPNADAPPAQVETAEPIHPAPAFTPTFTEADRAQLETIEAKRAEITQQADDGELSFAEAQAKLKEIDGEAAPILRKQIRDEERQAIYEEQNQEAWNDAVRAFLVDTKVDPTKISDEHWERLDAISRSLTGSPALVQGMDMGKQVQEVFRLFDAQNPGAWAGAKPWEAKAAPHRAVETKATDPKAPNEVQVPPTLGGLPSSDAGSGVEDGRFAALDRLAETDPLRYERELARLPEDVLDAYMRA